MFLLARHDWTRLEKWKKRQHAVVSLFDLSNFTSLLITHSHGADSRTIVFQLEMKIKTSLFRKIKVKPTRKRRDTNKYPEEENKCSTMKISISRRAQGLKAPKRKTIFVSNNLMCSLQITSPDVAGCKALYLLCRSVYVFSIFHSTGEKIPRHPIKHKTCIQLWWFLRFIFINTVRGKFSEITWNTKLTPRRWRSGRKVEKPFAQRDRSTARKIRPCN